MWNALHPDRLYRNDILSWRAWELRLTDSALAQKAGVSAPSVARVLRGEGCGVKTLWKVAEALKINRQTLIDFKLKERDFSRAVLNGKRN
jgi:transcriptional regulator with XRE-family HTH domain